MYNYLTKSEYHNDIYTVEIKSKFELGDNAIREILQLSIDMNGMSVGDKWDLSEISDVYEYFEENRPDIHKQIVDSDIEITCLKIDYYLYSDNNVELQSIMFKFSQ